MKNIRKFYPRKYIAEKASGRRNFQQEKSGWHVPGIPAGGQGTPSRESKLAIAMTRQGGNRGLECLRHSV